MKSILAIVFIFAATAANAAVTGSIDSARAVKEQVKVALTGAPGVNGVGLTSCNATTGELSKANEDGIYCVQILVADQNTADSVSAKYPAGTFVDGVPVAIEIAGAARPF